MKEKILKIITDFNNRGTTLSYFGKNQYSDWRIILSILSITFFVTMGFAGFTYFNEETDVDFFGSDANISTVKKINKEFLFSVVEKMEIRQENFESLKLNRPVVGDPSII